QRPFRPAVSTAVTVSTLCHSSGCSFWINVHYTAVYPSWFVVLTISKPDSWEIVEGLRGGFSSVLEPQKQEGYMLKRRKWPMKGWHKRYFFLDKGILKYGKCSADIEKGKLHGCIDVGLSVMAIKKKAKCIDLDAEENIYHLKIKSQELFDEWVSKLRHHRLYRQNEIAMYPNEKSFYYPHYPSPNSPNMSDGASIRKCMPVRRQSTVPSAGAFPLSSNSQAKVAAWLQSSDDMDKCSKGERVELCFVIHEISQHFKQYAVVHMTGLKPVVRKCLGLSYGGVDLSCSYYSCERCFSQKQDSVDESRPLVHQVSNESRASIAESLSEFFDAQEVLLSASSSENEVSEDDSYISDISDNISMDNFSNESERPNSGKLNTALASRRSCLPTPSPNNSTISLWNILRNNIGKDLSKVAMPVQLNEPLNTLQRLCEELEYSELLDRAANTQDPFERMIYMATFVVSGYASSYYRTGGKPFNPVLGETYECDRPDKGFRFVAEQVSHHPPISACHAESKNFVFWQDVRCKNKFWGKSMEIVPVGTTHVTLPGCGDHYEWNKVTSCIHNILSGQRWIEHYGEISIRNSNSDVCQCKITFVKAKYWNSSVNEIEGAITDNKGKVVHKLFGKWHEAVFCGDPPSAKCIWRANAMPVDHEQYYGFTKFAIELNELEPSLKLLLPPTDTRLRVDQRLLEEGNMEAAEEQKQRIEQLQRDRRRVLEENSVTHQPKFFRKSKDDTWVNNSTYWEVRKDPGFTHIDFPTLW
uniref:Oxysterol-binding protein n=1 Tax=Amphiprion ocellaris TaxID=80972 RepID=A0AAQ5XM42_AMPOC